MCSFRLHFWAVFMEHEYNQFVPLLVTIPNFPLHFLSVTAVEDDVIAQLLRAVVPPSAAWGFAGPISGPWVIASRSFSLVVIQFPLGFTVCISCVWVLSFLFVFTVCISCVLCWFIVYFLPSTFPVCGFLVVLVYCFLPFAFPVFGFLVLLGCCF